VDSNLVLVPIVPSVPNYFTRRNEIIFKYMELIKYLVHTINILFIENLITWSPSVGGGIERE